VRNGIRLSAALTLAALTLSVSLATAADQDHAATGVSALDPIKQLEGDWVGKAGHDGQQVDAAVSYHVTANGSAVMETLFPGTPHEMVTIYTVDKGALVLTHYCALGNQPRMRARKSSALNELAFEFAGGAGINPAKDEHMHAVRLRFVDADHLQSEWTDWKGGKPSEVMVFDLERKK
jgi:hypothetical protein